LRFALSNPLTNIAICRGDIARPGEIVNFVAAFKPMAAKEQPVLISEVAPFSRRLVNYKL
jgi:hypothetical protein